MKIVFESATFATPEGGTVSDLFTADGKIVNAFPKSEADRIVDCRGKFLMPGVIDCHVHFREPGGEYKEDWNSGSRAAVIGGVTTVLDMPNTNPPTVSLEALEEKRKLVHGRSYVNYGFFFGVDGANFDGMASVRNVPGYKMYMGSSTGSLLADKPEVWEKAFRIAKSKNLPIVVHAEDEASIKAGKRDCDCAMIAVDAALQLRKTIGNKLHIAHVSCAGELSLIQKNHNSDLTCEVCPHHLYFSIGDMHDAYLKMYPPLRREEDLRALWEGIRSGAVNIIATDHAPHSLEEKAQALDTAPAGVPGVEFVLPLMLNEVNNKMLSFERLIELLCRHPAAIFGIKNKGRLEVGYDADLVLVDMTIEKTITRDMVLSKCGWSPYEGYKLKGWPVMTVVGGEVVCENREVLGGKLGRECDFW
ncbi:dihydroorotase [Candidatus Peregrinibacteria bacterium]|nr:dihydroorotase [Candidatus Peregrinibacteria bacterium]